MKKEHVIFAGAGPGDPDLITVKAMNALKNADLIIYAGSLVPEAVLCWKSEVTLTMSSAGMDLTQIIKEIETQYRKKKKVVRLHTGDPSIYGAIFEQMRALDALEIPYKVIPGVSASFAAAAAMKMAYTLPEITQTLILTRISGRTPVPETEDLEALAAHKSSMAIYLSLGQVDRVQKIIEKRYGAEALCAVAYKVSHPEEKIYYMQAKDMAQTCKEKNITRHAHIIVGPSVEANKSKGRPLKSKLYDSSFSHGYRQAE